MGRIPGLDLLRCFAVLAVVLFHWPRSQDQVWLRALSHFGYIGVDLFFVLSGYLIGGQLFQKVVNGARVSLLDFYIRRFFRIIPPYGIALFAAIAIWPLVKGEPLRLPGVSYLFFAQNFGIPPVFGHSWSLCVEEHFYLIFPLALLWFLRSGKGSFSRGAWTLGLILVGGMGLRALLWEMSRPDLATLASVDQAFEIYLKYIYYPTYSRLDGLTLGVGMAALQYFRPALWERLLKEGNLLMFGGVGFLAVAAFITYSQRRFSLEAAVLGFPLYAAGFSLLVASAVSPASVLSRLRIPLTGGIAAASYSVYLCHADAIGVGQVITASLGVAGTGLAAGAIGALCVASISAVLYLGVEKPALRLRQKILARGVSASVVPKAPTGNPVKGTGVGASRELSKSA